MRVLCVPARPLLVGRIAEGRPLPGWVEAHRDRCLRCRALAARTQAALRAMPEALVATDPGAPDFATGLELEGSAASPRWLPVVAVAAVAGAAAGWWLATRGISRA